MTPGSSNLTAEQTDINARIFGGIRYTTIQSGDPQQPTRRQRRSAMRRHRLRGDGKPRQWW